MTINIDAEKHQLALDTIHQACLKSDPTINPVQLALSIMQLPEINLHGPEHHVLVGATLLTTYAHTGVELNLQEALNEMVERGRALPPSICGHWGCCGAAVSNGIFLSIILRTTPFSVEDRRTVQVFTAESLMKVSVYGGPRCCKRESFTSLLYAIDFLNRHFGILLDRPKQLICPFSEKNKATCIGSVCAFNKNTAICRANI